MNDLMHKIILGIVELFAMFGIGAFAFRMKYIDEADLKRLPGLIIDILFPMLIFSSIVNDLDTSRLSEYWILPVIGFGLMFFGGVLGFPLRAFVKNRDPNFVNTFHHFCAINNYGFLPLIIVANINPKALPLVFLLNIGSGIGYWSIGIALLGGKDIKRTLKNIFSPNLFAIVLALFIASMGWQSHMPDFIMKPFAKLGACAIPLMLILIGATLFSSRSLLKNKRDMVYLSVVRLLVIPMLSIFILKMLPISQDIARVAFIVAIMPVSVSSTIITRRYGGDPEFAGQAALVTTILSIGTIPLFVYFYM